MKSKVMRTAWNLFRKGVSSFSMALKMAWANARSRNAAAEAAGLPTLGSLRFNPSAHEKSPCQSGNSDRGNTHHHNQGSGLYISRAATGANELYHSTGIV